MDSDPKPGVRAWRLVEPVWEKINTYDEPREFLNQFRQVRPEVGHLFAACWCVAEVCNGGFDQFFFNSTGVLAPEALAAFRAIGLVVWASLLEEAMQFFGDPYPRGQEERWECLSRAEVPGAQGEECDEFCALDDRFYAWLHEQEYRWERAVDAYADQVDA
jgi:hypothetical protein